MSSARPSISRLNKRFKGVRCRPWGKWVCEIRLPNTRSRIWLGSHATPEAAARAYDFALVCLRGPEVQLNFPDSPPKVPANCSLSPKDIQTLARSAALREESISVLSLCKMTNAVDFSNHSRSNQQQDQVSQIDAQQFQSTSKIENFVSSLLEDNAKTESRVLDSVMEPLESDNKSAWIQHPASDGTHIAQSKSNSSTTFCATPTDNKGRRYISCDAFCSGFNAVSSSGQIGWESTPATFESVSHRSEPLIWDT